MTGPRGNETPGTDHTLSAKWRDRAVPVGDLSPEGRSGDTLIFDTPRGQLALCCPVRGISLTAPMAAAAGLSYEALSDMVIRRTPLGVDNDTWNEVGRSLLAASQQRGATSPALSEGAFEMAVGGSAVGCFSSAQTALGKKSFPQHERELAAALRRSPSYWDAPEDVFATTLADATEVYRGLKLGTTPPLAPWFGILSRLGLEGTPDVDIQVRSDVIDAVLLERAAHDPSIHLRRDADRLDRWHQSDVCDAFPVLSKLQDSLASAHVELEFLGPKDPNVIRQRTDWWPILGLTSARPGGGLRPGMPSAQAVGRRTSPPYVGVRPPVGGPGARPPVGGSGGSVRR